MTEEELGEFAELEPSVFSERAKHKVLIENFFEPTSFERYQDGVQGWMHSYKKVILIPKLYKDLRILQNKIRLEVLKILENESRFIGPLKFNLGFVIRFTRESAGVVERVECFIEQEEPILVKVFDRRIVTRKLNMLFEENLESFAMLSGCRMNDLVVKVDDRLIVAMEQSSAFTVEGITEVYLRIRKVKRMKTGPCQLVNVVRRNVIET